MSILLNEATRVVGQGITGKAGSFHALANLAYGTSYVGAVTPGKGGQKWEGRLPIFDRVQEAVERTGANTSVVFVPPPFAADAILEAIAAGIGLIVCITEGIPVQDMLRVKQALKGSFSKLIGPNCPGILVPDLANIGIMPPYIAKRGGVGVVSRSGTLTYEAVYQLSQARLGQSTCVGIGGDPIGGLSHAEVIALFNEDPETEAIVLIGEIGGTAEEEAASYIQKAVRKPVVAFIAGLTAPLGRRMGHAGAIVSGTGGSAQSKINSLQRAGVSVASTPACIASTLVDLLKQ